MSQVAAVRISEGATPIETPDSLGVVEEGVERNIVVGSALLDKD